MSQEHPITPPPELVQQWIQQYGNSEDPRWQAYEQDIATQAARWGADQELKACCEWLLDNGNDLLSPEMRKDRRPKPPSLKKVAYNALDTYIYGNPDPKDKERTYNAIRRALESLPD